MERVRYYKVVSKEGNRLYSWVTNDGYKVEYVIGQWVKGVYPLFVFNNVHTAYRHKGYSDELWEVEVKNPRRLNYISDMPKRYDQFWRSVEEGTVSLEDDHVFEGRPDTFVADEVMLIAKLLP